MVSLRVSWVQLCVARSGFVFFIIAVNHKRTLDLYILHVTGLL